MADKQVMNTNTNGEVSIDKINDNAFTFEARTSTSATSFTMTLAEVKALAALAAVSAE
jgi:hypothetical protein